MNKQTKNSVRVINELALETLRRNGDQFFELTQETKPSRVARSLNTSKDKKKRERKDRGYED